MEMITDLIFDSPALAQPVVETTSDMHQGKGTVDIERQRDTSANIRSVATATSKLVDRTGGEQAYALRERTG